MIMTSDTVTATIAVDSASTAALGDYTRRDREGVGAACHRSAVVAFRDLLYITTYVDGRNQVVDERHERLKDIFEPGASRMIDLNDGFSAQPFANARLQIVAAEALVPAPN